MLVCKMNSAPLWKCANVCVLVCVNVYEQCMGSECLHVAYACVCENEREEKHKNVRCVQMYVSEHVCTHECECVRISCERQCGCASKCVIREREGGVNAGVRARVCVHVYECGLEYMEVSTCESVCGGVNLCACS